MSQRSDRRASSYRHPSEVPDDAPPRLVVQRPDGGDPAAEPQRLARPEVRFSEEEMEHMRALARGSREPSPLAAWCGVVLCGMGCVSLLALGGLFARVVAIGLGVAGFIGWEILRARGRRARG